MYNNLQNISPFKTKMKQDWLQTSQNTYHTSETKATLYIPQLDLVSILEPKPELNPLPEAELVPAPHPRLAELVAP
uniref:Uncharacterized protein n=1 Tax=Electrophorus electricus TaxID=8005 RepID=A0A4W4HG60_ELEEL